MYFFYQFFSIKLFSKSPLTEYSPKNETFVIIYSPSFPSKIVYVSFLCSRQMNMSMKGWGLNKLNDWINPASITREKSGIFTGIPSYGVLIKHY